MEAQKGHEPGDGNETDDSAAQREEFLGPWLFRHLAWFVRHPMRLHGTQLPKCRAMSPGR